MRNANERQQARALNMDKVVAGKGSMQQDHLFDYNTMKAVLLACGVFVCHRGPIPQQRLCVTERH